MPKPLTDINALVRNRPDLAQFFDPANDQIVGIKPLPTDPHMRVLVTRQQKEPVVYPMWDDIDQILEHSGKEYRLFEGIMILSGIGLGYMAQGIVKHLGPYATLTIWEPDPEWLRAACWFRDLGPLFANKQVQIVIGGKQALHNYLDLAYTQQTLTVGTIIDTCMADMYPERRAMMDETVPTLLKTYEGNRCTIMGFGPMFIENTVKSLRHLSSSFSVSHLENAAPHIPALVVGSGPGLLDNISTIKSINRNPSACLILAADSAIAPLLKHDIIPDLVFSVDPQKETAQKFTHLPKGWKRRLSRSGLVYHPGAHHKIPSVWPGMKIHTTSSMPPMPLFKEWTGNPPGTLGDGVQCQVHLAYDTAVFMGCKPILLAGIDLCYKDAKSLYAEQPSYIDGHEEEVFSKGIVEMDMHGNPVTVTSQFDQYRHGFAERALTTKTINVNSQGLAIKNTKKMPLVMALVHHAGLRFVDFGLVLDEIKTTALMDDDGRIAIRKKIREICKDLRFYQLISKYIVLTALGGDRPQARDLISRWAWKLCRRKESTLVLAMLEGYGHIPPAPLKRTRMSTLYDQIQGRMEWVAMETYYRWLSDSATTVLKEFEDAYIDLASTQVSTVPALGNAQPGTH